MSLSEYAREKGIPATTLRGWVRLDRALAFGKIDLKLQFNEKSNGQSKVNQPIKKCISKKNYTLYLLSEEKS